MRHGAVRCLGRVVGLAAALWWPLVASAADQHVDASFAGESDGSQARPWKSISEAMAKVGPGDTVRVAAGSYDGFNIHDKIGRPGKPIRVMGTPSSKPGTPALTNIGGAGRKYAGNKDGINIQRSSHIELVSLTLVGTGDPTTSRAGVGIHSYWKSGPDKANFRDVAILHCTIRDFGYWGVLTGFEDNVRVENCVISGSRREHGVYLSNTSTGHVVRNNLVFDNACSGIQLNGSNGDDPEGGRIRDSLVENNILWNNGGGSNHSRGGGGALNNESVSNCVYRNNLLYDNKASGIVLWNGTSTGRGSHDCLVTHNTVVQLNSKARSALLISAEKSNRPFDCERNVVVNNVFIHVGAEWKHAAEINGEVKGLVCDHNIYIGALQRDSKPDGGPNDLGFQAWQGKGIDAHSRQLKPEALAGMFVKYDGQPIKPDASPSAAAFMPSPNSPLRDAGNATADPMKRPAAETDLAGNPRVTGAAPDVGAVEAK